MTQEIITYIIVAFAFGYSFKGLYDMVRNEKSGCSSGSCGCGEKSTLFNAIKKGKKPYILK
jgi:hypothetical protein